MDHTNNRFVFLPFLFYLIRVDGTPTAHHQNNNSMEQQQPFLDLDLFGNPKQKNSSGRLLLF
jgi:hypothetical protein